MKELAVSLQDAGSHAALKIGECIPINPQGAELSRGLCRMCRAPIKVMHGPESKQLFNFCPGYTRHPFAHLCHSCAARPFVSSSYFIFPGILAQIVVHNKSLHLSQVELHHLHNSPSFPSIPCTEQLYTINTGPTDPFHCEEVRIGQPSAETRL